MTIQPDSGPGRYAGVQAREPVEFGFGQLFLSIRSFRLVSLSRIQCITSHHRTTTNDAERQGRRGYGPLDLRKGHILAVACPSVDATPETKAYGNGNHPCLDCSILDSHYL